MALYEETKQLQKENDAKFSGTEVPDRTFVQAFRERANALKGVDYQSATPLDISLTPSDTPKSWGRRLGPFYDPSVQQENFLAEQQSGWQRMGYMIPRIATKALSEVAQLPGYLGGAIAWGVSGFDAEDINMMVDNFWQRAIQDVEQDVKDRLPVYTADVVKNGNLMKNILSTSFWANEGADGIGFLMAFLAPGAALRFAGAGAKAAKLIKPGTVIAKAGQVGKATEQLTAAGMKFAGNIDDITSTIVNTLFESAAEGGETYRNVFADTGDKQRAAEAAVDVVQKNIGILSISNYIDQKWLFGKSGLIKDYAAATKGLAKGSEYNRVFSTAMGTEGKLLDQMAKRTNWNQIGKLSKTLLTGTVKEGFWEEGMQFAASKQAEEGGPDDEGFINEIVDLAKTYVDNLGNVDMQKSIFLGSVLGSVMSGVKTVRDMKSEDRFLGDFHRLVKEGNLDRYTSMSDLFVIDPETNRPKLGADGKPQIDETKSKEQLAQLVGKYAQNKQLIHLAKTGNVEAFEKLKNIRDFNYFLPFLQSPGGLEAAIYHINNLAETDMKWMQEEGAPIDIEATKKELTDKVIQFQKIYDKVSDTHDLNINVKHNKEDKPLFDEFSVLVKNKKLETEANIRFSLERLNALRKDLASYPTSATSSISISSGETAITKKIVDDLDIALNENKANLSESDILEIKKSIKNITGYINLITQDRKELGELYDNKYLQNEFKTFKEYRDTSKKTSEEEGAVVEKAKVTADLSPGLAKLYNEAIKVESFQNNAVTHSGQIAAEYRDEAGNLNTLTFEILGKNTNKNLNIRALKHEAVDSEGNFVVTTLNDLTTHYLNGDGTIYHNGKTYTLEGEPILVKSPDTVLEERKAAALIQSIEQVITGYNNGIEELEGRINEGIEYRNDLQDRLNKLLEKEKESQEKTGTFLTATKEQRKQLVKLHRERGKTIEKVYLTSIELIDEINKADTILNELTTRRDALRNNVTSLKSTLETIKPSKDILDSMKKVMDNLTEMSDNYDNLLTSAQESLEGSKDYLNKLLNVIKGFHTSAARILGIEDNINIIREREDLDIDTKNELITALISDSFSKIENSDTAYEELSQLQNTIAKIQSNIAQEQQKIVELNSIVERNRKLKQGYDRIILLNRNAFGRFNKNYLDLANKLKLIKATKAKKAIKTITPEERFGNIRNEEGEFITGWEKDAKHPFVVYTNPEDNVNNWLMSTGNQKQAESNDDIARWYLFVNKHAYKIDPETKRHLYILKTYSFDQIGKLGTDDPIRQNTTFATSERGDLKTYDQIADKTNKYANEDIKLIVFDRASRLVRVSKNGDLADANDKSQILFSSLPLARTITDTTGKVYERFTYNKEREKFLKNNRGATDADFKKYIDTIVEKSRADYETLRSNLKANQITLEINTINPGKKVKTNDLEENVLVEQDLLNAAGLAKANSLYRKIVFDNRKTGDDYNTRVRRNVSGTEHSMINGFWYLLMDNRLELIKPKTLGDTGSVDTIVALLQHIAKDLDKNNEVRDYINTIIYSGVQNSTGTESKFRFYFDYLRDEKGKIVGEFNSIVFGEYELSRQELAEGKNLEPLKNFLKDKYWNFDNKHLNDAEFTEYVVGKESKIIPKLWEIEDGGYKGFLFSNNPAHENQTKGTVYVKPRAKEGLPQAREPQYTNQSLSLIKQGTKIAEVPTTNKTVNTTIKSDNLVGGQPFVPFGQTTKTTPTTQTTQITQTKAPQSATNLVGGQPFIPFGQQAPKPNEPNGLGDQTPPTNQIPTERTWMNDAISALAQYVDKSYGEWGKTIAYPDSATLLNLLEKSKTIPEDLRIRLSKTGIAIRQGGVPTLTKTVKVGSPIPKVTPEEHWEKQSEDRKTSYLKGAGNDLNIAKQNAYASYLRVLKLSGDLSREATKYDNYERENLEAAKTWLKAKFPNIPVKIIEEGLIDGKDWGKLTKDAVILLSSIAEIGTGYHEGFHTFSQLVLTPEQRTSLYSEVKTRLGKPTLTDKKAEEVLAEEFRLYMLSPETYVFGENEVAKKSLFRQLLDLILDLLRIDRTEKFNIESTFATLRDGSFDVHQKQLPNSFSREVERTRVPGLTDKETLVFIRDMNYMFFDTLFGESANYMNSHLFSVDEGVSMNDIYNDISNVYFDLAELHGPDSYYAKIVDNFANLKKEHLRFLKPYKINVDSIIEEIKDEQDNDEDAAIDRSTYAYSDHLEIDPLSLVDNPVRMLIAGLPTVVKDGRLLEDITEYKTRSTVRFNRIMRLLSENLTNLGTDFNVYADKITWLAEKYPELNELLKRLQVGQPDLNPNIIILRNQFVRVFGHHRSTPLMTNYKSNGVKNTFDASDQERTKLIRTKWTNGAMNLATDETSFITKNKRGSYIISTKKLQDAIKNSYTFKEESRDRLDSYLEVLKKLGVVITSNNADIYDYKVVHNYIDRLSQELSARSKSKAELLLSDLFNKNIVENQKETAKLVEYAKQFFLNDTDLSFYNQDGNREYPVNLPSYTTTVADTFNRITYNSETDSFTYPEEAEFMQVWNGKTGNLFMGYSEWREYQKVNTMLKVVDLKGIIDQANNKNNSRISNATPGDYKAVTFNALLDGQFVQMRSADRRRELAFVLVNKDTKEPIKINSKITRDTFKDKMSKYLRDELMTSFALLIELKRGGNMFGANLNHYSKNAKTLRSFNFLYDNELNAGDRTKLPILEDYVERKVSVADSEDTIVLATRLTNEFTAKYTGFIDSSFDRFITKMNTITEQSLKEDSVLTEKFTSDGKSMGIYPRGVDTEALKNMGIYVPTGEYNLISREQIDKMILFANYISYIGNQEQLKYIMGDLAMWEDTTDFHKRVNGATSPKNVLADSNELRQLMDANWDRIDGKHRTDSIDIVVVNDIISSNKLADIYEEYGSVVGTDAESYFLLDEYRDTAIRHGEWYDGHEKTYQYEMQKFILRLLNLKANGYKHPFLKKISKQMFTDPEGVFYKHTNGVFPTEPMYKGIKLSTSPESLSVLTIKKPQGFGTIDDAIGVNAPQFFKTSTAPLFPSVIPDDSQLLDTVLSMMDKQQGILAFSSSMKGSVANNQNLYEPNGKIPKGGYISQKLKYSDFGFQLDISDKEKGDVTVSTQRTRFEFLNIFDGGILAKGKEHLQPLKVEYDKLVNEIVAEERDIILKSLGLSVDSETGTYKLNDADDIKTFKDRLIRAFDFALLPYNIIDGVDFALASEEKVFDMTVNKLKIEEILTALIRRNVISRKTKGDMLVMESGVLYSKNLEFYRIKNGKVLPMEIKMAIPIDLIPVMNKIGGLANLNKAISDYYEGKENSDIEKLGEDFFKILDIPMNRIPGQSLSSLDVARVKEFLPHYHGAKVIVPPELTVKAGSDFDVDKMTSYFYYYEVKNGKVKYIDNQDSLSGKKNRINKIAVEALLDPTRFNELIQPLTSKNIKSITQKVQKKIDKTAVEIESFNTAGKQQNKWENVVTWWYNMQKGNEFFKSKKGTAIAVTHNAANAFAQQHPVRMKAIVPLFFEGHMIGQEDYYGTGFMEDSDGYQTSRTFGEFLSAFVDVVKDPFIFDLTDSNTFNVLAFLNRYGKDAGIGIETIAEFMTQPIVIEYLRIKRENSPKFLDFKHRLNYEKQYKEAIDRMKAKLADQTVEDIPNTYDKSVAATLNQLLDVPYGVEFNEQRELIKTNIRNKIEIYKYREFSKKDLGKASRTSLKDQIQILDNFLTYQTLAGKLVSLNLMLRPDARSSMTRHLSSIDANVSIPYASMFSTELFNIDDFDKALGIGAHTGNNTLLTEFFRTQAATPTYFGNYFITQKDPIVKAFMDDQVLPYFANPKTWRKKKDIDGIMATVDSDLMTFIIADGLGITNYSDMQKWYSDLFVNENSVPGQLLEFKKRIEGNLAINELEPIIAKRITKSRAISETDNISLFNKNFDVQELDAIESDLYALGVEPDRRNQQFIFNLMMHSVFQSGFSNAANSYMQVIPNRFFIDIAEKAVGHFMELSDDAKRSKLASFYEQFFRNNVDNTNIVPRHPWMMTGGKGMKYGYKKEHIDEKGYYKNYNFVSFNYYTANPISYFKQGQNPPMGIALYKRTGDNTFTLVSKQGYGINMKEYYPQLESNDVDNVSIIESSRYNPRELDIVFEEEVDNDYSSGAPIGEPMPFGRQTHKFDRNKLNEGDFSYLPTGQLSSYAKVLGSETTMHRALRMVENKTNNPSRRALASILKSATKTKIPLFINRTMPEFEIDSNTGQPGSAGLYDYNNRESFLYESLDDTGFEVAVLHEALHAASHDAVENNPEFKARIQKIADHAYDYILRNYSNRDIIQQGYDIFTNPHEFITHGFTSSTFQSILAKIPAENPEIVAGKTKDISVLQDFIGTLLNVIKKYFNDIFGITRQGYNSEIQSMESTLKELILTVDENLREELKPAPIINVLGKQTNSSDEIKVINKAERDKGDTDLSFDEVYPQYAHLDNVEREAFKDAVDKGIIQIACKI